MAQDRKANRDFSPSVDGHIRSKEQEKKLNSLAFETFKTITGRKFLEYLRSITIENVLGPAADDATLRHLEGQRFIIGIIETRYRQGENARKKGE